MEIVGWTVVGAIVLVVGVFAIAILSYIAGFFFRKGALEAEK